MNPKTQKIEDWFLYDKITLESDTISADDIKYKNKKQKTKCDKNTPILIFKDWIHENADDLFDNEFHLVAEISPNDPRKVKELVLPKLPNDIDEKISSFQKMYGVRKIDWVQYLVHEMHLDRFMASMRKAKNKKLERNEIQQEFKDCDENEHKEQENNEQVIDVEGIIDKLNDDDDEVMKELDNYLARNANQVQPYDDTVESEESDIFQEVNNCEHSENESESESEAKYEKNRYEIDESDSDEFEMRTLEPRK